MFFQRGAVFFGLCLLVLLPCGVASAAQGPGDLIDFTQSVVLREVSNPVVASASHVLIDEVRDRTGIRLSTVTTLDRNTPAIILGTRDGLPVATPVYPAGVAVPEQEEGFALWIDNDSDAAPRVYVVGHDGRGVLYGVGRLLRALEMRSGSLVLDPDFRIATAPKDRIRGHQLGYRDANNTWDAWNVGQFEQYIRDLIVFGTNSIELIPNFDEDLRASPHMPLTTSEMNSRLCKVIDSYGLDVWAWHALRGDVSDETHAQEELKRARHVFQELPVLDAVFVPGGDPGDTPPVALMPFLAKFAAELRDVHPDAELWVSTQGFEPDQNDFFFNYLATEKPDWLTGVIFGPWAKMNLEEIRERTPQQYRVRSYPDITHTVRCQYPVPHWDRAFAHTLGREPANPRPMAEAHIHNREIALSEGFITYSDGVNDDVNKMIWSACGWDPQVDVQAVLRDYSRYFFGPDFAADGAAGLLAEENNWAGPLEANTGVDETLKHWQAMENRADPKLLGNWRFQLGLLRAYYDAYVKARLAQASDAESRAYAELAKAPEVGATAALDAAENALAMYDKFPAAPDLRMRIDELGKQLFESIGMQLSVEKYGASGKERGAVLDGLDSPLNDRAWLQAQFAAIRAESKPETQLADIERLVKWEQPTPDALYDDLGNGQKEPHLVYQKTWAEDPGFVESPQDEFSRSPLEPQDPLQLEPKAGPRSSKGPPPRLSWLDQGETLFRTDLLMHYDHLDPTKTYTLRAVYAGRFHATMKLMADDVYEVHGPIPYSEPTEVREFPIPPEATKDGVLDLRWIKVEGRGPQVAEVWLVPNP